MKQKVNWCESHNLSDIQLKAPEEKLRWTELLGRHCLGVEIRANGGHEHIFKLFQVAWRIWYQAWKQIQLSIISQSLEGVRL